MAKKSTKNTMAKKSTKNTKQTSPEVASTASKVLRDKKVNKASKTLAGSALSQTKKRN